MLKNMTNTGSRTTCQMLDEKRDQHGVGVPNDLLDVLISPFPFKTCHTMMIYMRGYTLQCKVSMGFQEVSPRRSWAAVCGSSSGKSSAWYPGDLSHIQLYFDLSLKSDQVDNLEESVKVGLEKVEAACWEMVDSATVS